MGKDGDLSLLELRASLGLTSSADLCIDNGDD